MKIRIYDANRRNEPKSGYGLMSSQISENLKALGEDICFFPRVNDTEDVVLWIRPPHYIKYPEFKNSKKNVFYTMHEEETFTGWKSDWPELLNKCEAVIVPTEWNKKVFENNGVVAPIYVVPLGVSPRDFHGAKTYKFSILALHDALGSDNSREDWKSTLRAYYEAFESDDDVLLTIKSYNLKRDEFYEYVGNLKAEFNNKTLPIDIVELDIDAQGLNNLYGSHWLFVKNAKREGWSLPLLEAMACNMDVAYTDLPIFEWATPYKHGFNFPLGDTSKLAEIFQDRYKHWKRDKGFINSLSWKKCAKEVQEVLKNV